MQTGQVQQSCALHRQHDVGGRPPATESHRRHIHGQSHRIVIQMRTGMRSLHYAVHHGRQHQSTGLPHVPGIDNPFRWSRFRPVIAGCGNVAIDVAIRAVTILTTCGEFDVSDRIRPSEGGMFSSNCEIAAERSFGSVVDGVDGTIDAGAIVYDAVPPACRTIAHAGNAHRLGIDVSEVPPIRHQQADRMMVHAISGHAGDVRPCIVQPGQQRIPAMHRRTDVLHSTARLDLRRAFLRHVGLILPVQQNASPGQSR